MKFRHRLWAARNRSGRFRSPSARLRYALALAGSLTLCACVFGQAAPPAAADPKPAAPAPLPHDQHGGLTVSVDPYTDSARSKEKFGKANPNDVGILPVEVFLRNDLDEPMRVNLETIQLEVNLRNGVRQEVDWMRAEEVANLIAHPTGSASPKQKRLPLPIPITITDKKVEKLAAILRPLTLDADVIPPKATMHGFLYFNVSNEMSVANRSSLYIPDVTFAISTQPLVYFEVPLRNSRGTPAGNPAP